MFAHVLFQPTFSILVISIQEKKEYHLYDLKYQFHLSLNYTGTLVNHLSSLYQSFCDICVSNDAFFHLIKQTLPIVQLNVRYMNTVHFSKNVVCIYYCDFVIINRNMNYCMDNSENSCYHECEKKINSVYALCKGINFHRFCHVNMFAGIHFRGFKKMLSIIQC